MAPISVAPFALNPVPKTVSKDASITTMHELTVERKVGTKPTLTNGYQPVKTQTAPKTVINFRAPTPPPPTTVPTIPATVPVKGVTKVQPVPKTGTALVPKSAMHLTALGTQILSSSSKPVASVDPPHKAVLTKTASTSGPKTQNVAVPVISIPDSTAPSKQSHAQVWQAALKAAQTVSPVKVNNDVLHNPSIASADSNNKMFKVGLADLVRTKPEGSVTIQATAAPPLIVPTDVNKELLDKAPISAVSVHLPENLVKHVDTGSQPQKDITATTPPGFVLTGDPTKLFGFLEAERFTFHGNSSPDGKAEMMIPTTKDFTLDSLFGSDKVMLSGMKLGSPSISWYKTSTGKKKAGLWIDATLALSDKLQNLATDLKKVLGKDTPEIQVSGYLGQFTDWSTAPLPPDQLKLRGNIPDVSALLGKHIAFASVDVKCQALKGAQSQDGKQVYTWTYTLEGDLDLTVPGSVTPLSLKYNLAKSGNLYTLNMKLDKHNEWNNAMGVHGMHLVDVEVTNVFDKDKADGKEKFDLKAKFRTETTDLNITGSYEESDWSLSSTCPSLSWDQVDSLFNDMFGSRLQPFNHKISLNNLNLEASSAKKNISLDCQLTIDEHPVVDAEISLSSDGFHMSVKSLEDVTFGLVKVKKAAMEIFVGKVGDVNPDPKKPGTASFFTVKGEIEVGSIIVDATAYLDKDDPNSEAKWVLFAEYKNKLQLSSVSKLSGTSDILKELDFALEDVVVIAASTDKMNPDICAQIKYPIKQGFFISAQVDAPASLTKALRSGPKRLGIELDLSQNSKQLDFVFGSPQALVLKKGMSAPVVTAGLKFDPLELFVQADMPIVLSDQSQPLDFRLLGEIDLSKAKLEASLQTDWVNPFGVSPHVTILAPFGLGVEIIYVSEFYPSGLEFSGGLMIGESKFKAAFAVTDSPKEGVIFVQAEHLGIKDIISFASHVVEHDLPQPSSDFLEFQDLKLAVSTGATVEGVFFPAGVSFKTKMLIFSKTVEASANMVKSPPKLSISGSIQAFELGPLAITGHTGKNLSVALEFGKDLQHIFIDGEVRLWELDVGIMLKADLHPLDLSIDADLDFNDVFKFHLTAKVEGEVKSLKEIGKCDFTFEATLEQHIIEYIMAHANSYILTAKKAADDGIDNASAKLAEAQKSFNDTIDKAQAELNAKKNAWDKQNAATVAAANARKVKVSDDEAHMRKSVDEAKQKFDAVITKLETKLAQTKQTKDAELKAANNELNVEKTKIDSEVNAKVHKLQQAQASLSHSFGDADTGIKNAEKKVNDAELLVSLKQQEIDNARHDEAHASFFQACKLKLQITELSAEKVGLETALRIAQGILAAAKAIVDGPGYHLAHDAITAAEDALNTAKKAGDAALIGLEAAVTKTEEAQDALIAAAEKELEKAKTQCDESKLWDVSQKALDTYLQTKVALLAEADKAVAALEQCAEKIAYDAASVALVVAKAGTKEIDVAKGALVLAKEATDEVAKLGSWMVEHTGNIFDVKEVMISGALSSGKDKGKPLKAVIEGVFADKEVHLELDFMPGKAEDMLKEVFAKIMEDVKKDIGSFVKKL